MERCRGCKYACVVLCAHMQYVHVCACGSQKRVLGIPFCHIQSYFLPTRSCTDLGLTVSGGLSGQELGLSVSAPAVLGSDSQKRLALSISDVKAQVLSLYSRHSYLLSQILSPDSEPNKDYLCIQCVHKNITLLYNVQHNYLLQAKIIYNIL